jgi:glycosyltransferase involved in cell wall biosynthesis
MQEFLVEDESASALVRQIQQEGDHFKPGREAQALYGIAYVGSWENYHDGMGVAVRRHAVALAMTGVPLILQSETFTHSNLGVRTQLDFRDLPPVVEREVGHLFQINCSCISLIIRHTVAAIRNLESASHPFGMRFMSEEYLKTFLGRTVICCPVEENKLSEHKVKCLNMVGQVWVCSEAAAEWLGSSGVDPNKIRVIPHPFYGKDPVANVVPKKNKDAFQFMSLGKWEPRKAQHTLIGGFLQEFSPRENVRLLLKSAPFSVFRNYPSEPDRSIAVWLRDPKVKAKGWSTDNVGERLIVKWHETVSRKKLADLYADSDVYVSTGRAEGFDLPAFDAKLAGLRLVHAASGGPWMYRTDEDILINGPEEKCHPGYNFELSTWAGFTAADVGVALREAYLGRNEPIEPFDREPFRMRAVGEIMRAACEELAPELKGIGRK